MARRRRDSRIYVVVLLPQVGGVLLLRVRCRAGQGGVREAFSILYFAGAVIEGSQLHVFQIRMQV